MVQWEHPTVGISKAQDSSSSSNSGRKKANAKNQSSENSSKRKDNISNLKEKERSSSARQQKELEKLKELRLQADKKIDALRYI